MNFVLRMIDRILQVRRDALARFEGSSEEYGNLIVLIRLDQVLGLIVFWYIGSLVTLALATFYGSLEAFGGGILSLAACTLITVPLLRWYLDKYDFDSSS
jgi:hypothetical protein